MNSTTFTFRKIVQRLDFGVLAIFVLPFFVSLINIRWSFNQPSAIDPWIYHAYFMRLRDFLQAFPLAYYGTRLPWIIPGYLSYHLFPPLIANYVLDLGCYYLTVFSIYAILRRTVSNRAGLMTAILLGSHWFFLLAVGWDYVDGIGITYCSLVMLALTGATTSHNKNIWLFLSGVFYACLIYVNTTWLGLTPVFVVYYWFMHRANEKRSIPKSLLLIVAGFLAITLVFCLINYSLTKQLWFFLPVVQAFFSISNDPQPWSYWDNNLITAFPKSPWLFLPGYTFFSGLTILLLGKTRFNQAPDINRSVYVFQGCLILASILMAAPLIKGIPFLQIYYYASYLLPFTFLAIGSQLDMLTKYLQPDQFFLLLLCFAASSVVALISPDSQLIPIRMLIIFLLIGLIGCWFLPILQSGSKKIFLLSLIMLSIASTGYLLRLNQGSLVSRFMPGQRVHSLEAKASPTEAKTLVNPGSFSQFLPALNPEELLYLNSFLIAVKSHDLLKQIDPKLQLGFWFNEKTFPDGVCVATGNMWFYKLIGLDFPALLSPSASPDGASTVEDFKKSLKRFPKIAILSANKGALEEVREPLHQLGFDVNLIGEYDLSQSEIPFIMTIVETIERGASIYGS
jgi:hypothetical protein